MPKMDSFLELWRENQAQEKDSFIKPISPFMGQPVSMYDGGTAHDNFIGGLICSKDYVFTSSEDQALSVWGGGSLDEIVTIYPGNCVNHLAISPCGKYLAAACDDYTAKVYEIPSMKLLHNLKKHDNYVSKVAFSQQGHLVSISKDGTVCVWDYEKGKLQHQLKGHEEWVYSLAVHPSKPLAVTGALNSSLKVWNLESGECVKDLVGGSTLMYVMGMSIGGGNSSGKGNEESTSSSVWLPNGKIVTCAHEVVVWDDTTYEVLWQGAQQNKQIKAVYYDEEKNMVVTASATVDGWNVDTGEQMFSQVGHDGNQIYSCYANGDVLYTGDEKGNINAWSINGLLSGGNKIQHSWPISDLKHDFELGRIISGSFDKSVIIWDMDGRPLKRFSNYSSSTKPLGAVPNQANLHVITSAGNIVIYDIVKMEEIKRIPLENSLVELDGLYWLDNERFIGYTLSYRPRIINIETGALTVFNTHCSFTDHIELNDNLVAFTSYPTKPLDKEYKADDEDIKDLDFTTLDVGAEGSPKDYTQYSPLMIFDTKKLKIVNHLWHKKEMQKADDKYYPSKPMFFEGNSLVIKYSKSDIHKWDLVTLEREQIFEFPGEKFGKGFLYHDDNITVFDSATDKVFQQNLQTNTMEEWMAKGNDKRNLSLTSDGKYLFFRYDKEYLKVLDFKTHETIFDQQLMNFRQLEFTDNKFIIGTEDGKVYVFEWGR